MHNAIDPVTILADKTYYVNIADKINMSDTRPPHNLKTHGTNCTLILYKR